MNCPRSRKAKLKSRRTSSLKCNCPFSLWIKECSDGWAIVEVIFNNNYELATIVTRLAEAPLRLIPKELQKFGETLKCTKYLCSQKKVGFKMHVELFKLGSIQWNESTHVDNKHFITSHTLLTSLAESFENTEIVRKN